MTDHERYAWVWAKRAAEAVDAWPNSREAKALLRVATELMPLEALIDASVEPGFAFIEGSPEARKIMRWSER